MPERLPMNSESLKARFPEVYRDLFENYPIVLSSAVHVGLLANSIGQRLGAPLIWQKLPLRLYLGFVPGGKKFEVQEVHFDSKSGEFFKENLGEFDREKLNSIYPAWSKSRYPINGGKFIFVWETGHARGLGASKYLHLAALPSVLRDAELTELLRDGRIEISSSQLDAYPRLLEIFRDTWELLLLLRPRKTSSNVLTFASLISSQYPITVCSPMISDIKMIPTATFVGMRMNDLFNPIPQGLLPDVALIYPGSTTVRYALLDKYEEAIATKHNEIVAFAKSFAPQLKEIHDTINNLELADAYGSGLKMFSFQAIDILKTATRFYQTGDSSDFLLFCRSIGALRGLKEFTEGPPGRNVRSIINTMISPDGDLAAVPLGIGSNDGDVLVIGQTQKYRSYVEEFINTHPDYILEYASWRDGWGEEGLKIEQHVDSGIKSTFLSESFKLVTYLGNKLEKKYARRAEIHPTRFDILFDGVEGKVWVKGQPTTSKELPTQKTTIAFFTTLMRRISDMVPNSALGDSPYYRYRNELQSKIVGPLEHVLTKRIKKHLGVTISGGLTQFTVQFNPQGLKIGLIEKV